MSRRVYLLGVGLALVTGAFLLTDALLWRPGVTEANARRIRPGMTMQSAEAILGEHGEPYWHEIVQIGVRLRRGSPTSIPADYYCWIGDAGRVWVNTDDSGRVRRVKWAPFRQTRPDLLSRLRAWLGW